MPFVGMYVIVGQSLLWADQGLPGGCVCVLCVLTGIELWIY